MSTRVNVSIGLIETGSICAAWKKLRTKKWNTFSDGCVVKAKTSAYNEVIFHTNRAAMCLCIIIRGGNVLRIMKCVSVRNRGWEVISEGCESYHIFYNFISVMVVFRI